MGFNNPDDMAFFMFFLLIGVLIAYAMPYKIFGLCKNIVCDKENEIKELMLHFNISKEDASFIRGNPALYKEYKKSMLNLILECARKE